MRAIRLTLAAACAAVLAACGSASVTAPDVEPGQRSESIGMLGSGAAAPPPPADPPPSG